MEKVSKIVIGLIIFIMIGVVICALARKTGDDNGNIANMGLLIEDNGTIYYNKYEKGIFAYQDGKEKQLTDETAYSLTIFKNKIYYITVADFSNVVIRSLDKNGENLKNVATIYTSLSKFFIKDGYIYYSTNKENEGIVRMDINGQNEMIIVSENVQDFQVVGNEIFYTNSSNQICKVSTLGENCLVLTEEEKARKIQVVDHWIYYYNENENALFRLSKNGKSDELVSVLVRNETYNVARKYVYYFDSENSKIARMKIGKSNQCDDIVNISTSKTKINVAKDELYYLDKSKDEAQTYQIYRVKLNGDEAKSIEY